VTDAAGGDVDLDVVASQVARVVLERLARPPIDRESRT
jgi:hypothetical protein